jgi:superfamily I DNA and/or RNA helicase
MHPNICSFPNEQFYQGRLRTAESLLSRASILPGHWLEKYPVLFVNISAQENSGTLYSKSRYNIAEAEMTAK